MKKFSNLFLMFAAVALSAALLTIFPAEGLAQPDSKPRVAIQLFEDRSGSGAPAEAITEMMTTELMGANIFTILEREKLIMMTTEQELADSGLADTDTAPERGKLKGAEFSMTGAITEYRYDTFGGAIPIGNVGIGVGSHTATVMLDIRIVNNRTGEVIMAAREKGSSNQTVGGIASRYGGFGGGKTGGILAGATHKVVLRVIEKIKTDGLAKMQGAKSANQADEAARSTVNVIAVDQKFTSATIDAGLNVNVRKGSLFAIYRAGSVIKDMSGNVLGEEKNYIAIIKVIDAQAAFSKCSVIKLSKNAKLMRGDKAERIKAVEDVDLN